MGQQTAQELNLVVLVEQALVLDGNDINHIFVLAMVGGLLQSFGLVASQGHILVHLATNGSIE